MARIGVIAPPVPGHIHPFTALGLELKARGHEVVFFQMKDVEASVTRAGLGFHVIGESDHPVGSLPVSLRELGSLKGQAALRFTIRAIRATTEMICRDAPEGIRHEGIELLLVDQTEPAGATVAEHLGLPFITICAALALNREPEMPPSFSSWKYSPGWFSRTRNRAGYFASDRVMSPVLGVLRKYRKLWGLPRLSSPDDSFSKIAQISQQLPLFDYPRKRLPSCFHYVGPLRKASGAIPFPWEKLDGRPLVYGSLGTLQNTNEGIFKIFGEACEGLGAQLVISHARGLNAAAVERLSRYGLIVEYAPQLELLAKASLTLTHAGLNTVLDSLCSGVPLVAVPLTYEQPAIAERLRWSGAGEVLAFQELSAPRLRALVERVLKEPSYHEAAKRFAASAAQAGGVSRAADIIEQAMKRSAVA